MRVVVSAASSGLDAPVIPSFGRCPFYVFVDTETLECEVEPNPSVEAPGGAGIQAAQFVVSQDVKAVLTGAIGPNAFAVLQAAGIPVFVISAGTVREAVQAYRAAHLSPLSSPTAQPQAGMGAMRLGRGGGRRGAGRGRGSPYDMGQPAPPATPQVSDDELADLKAQAEVLRDQLSQVQRRIEELKIEDSSR